MLEIKPENIDQLIDAITPEIYQSLRSAVEVGKWESGQLLSDAQKEHCLQAIIAYEHRYVPVNQRTGFMNPDTLASSRCAKDQDQ
jgi:uncharacterized protein YeaC (DUF1315 family)